MLSGFITGLFVQHMANPRMGLSAHLEGVMNGMLLQKPMWRDCAKVRKPDSTSRSLGTTATGLAGPNGATAPRGVTVWGDMTPPEGTAPDGLSSHPSSKLPSPSKLVAGKKHLIRQREEFVNAKSSKTAVGVS